MLQGVSTCLSPTSKGPEKVRSEMKDNTHTQSSMWLEDKEKAQTIITCVCVAKFADIKIVAELKRGQSETQN